MNVVLENIVFMVLESDLMAKKLYFAYGPNMDLKQMEGRCKDSKFIKVVFLKGYRFVYDGYSKMRNAAVGNIVKDDHSIVYGALFEIQRG